MKLYKVLIYNILSLIFFNYNLVVVKQRTLANHQVLTRLYLELMSEYNSIQFSSFPRVQGKKDHWFQYNTFIFPIECQVHRKTFSNGTIRHVVSQSEQVKYSWIQFQTKSIILHSSFCKFQC
jgi:hypothetical protein